MKFAHRYQRLLQDEFPRDWAQLSISYRQLKKHIKQIRREMSDRGYALSGPVEQITGSDEDEGSSGTDELTAPLLPPKFTLVITASDEETPLRDYSGRYFRPSLTLSPLSDGVDMADSSDKQLVPAIPTRLDRRQEDDHLEETTRLLDDASCLDLDSHLAVSALSLCDDGATFRESDQSLSTPTLSPPSATATLPTDQVIDIRANDTFFGTIFQDLCKIHSFQNSRIGVLEGDVITLRPVIKKVSTPQFRGRRTNDLAEWRELFLLYIESNIFVSTRERDAGTRTYRASRLAWDRYVDQVHDRGVLTKFKRSGSVAAFNQFTAINRQLLMLVYFHELNHEAVKKILKKLDKNLSVNTRTILPSTIIAPVSAGALHAAIWSTLSDSLLTIVPQLDDHLCAICLSVYYIPIRLDCGHVFCVTCVCHLQRMYADQCPVCRARLVIHTAAASQRDWKLTRFLIRYFRPEVVAKRSDDRRERRAVKRW